MQGVVASVPVRVADVGGWTDTWFGAPGWVCHLAVGPAIRVEARLGDGPAGVRLRAPDLGLDWTPARQSGVQDQWAAAMGGAGLLRIDPGDPQRRSALHRLADLALEAADALRTDDLAAQFRTHWTVPDLAPSGGVGCRPVG